MIISPYHRLLDYIRNKDSSTIDALDVELLDDDGKSHSNFAKTRDFFDLDLWIPDQTLAKWLSISNICPLVIDATECKS